MEVIKSDDSLREEILKDAKKKAERIVNKAENEKEEIHKETEKKIVEFELEYRKNIENEIEKASKIIKSGIDIEVKKITESFCGDIINDFFISIEKSIKDNEDLNYKDIIFSLIILNAHNINCDSFIIELSRNEKDKIKKEELLSLKLKKGKIKNIYFGDIKEGLILYTEDKKIASYISIKKLLDSLNPHARTSIYKIIFEGK